jgi:predicted RNA-binding Zn-ribbon protein involved in translation (DUF1610 family)
MRLIDADKLMGELHEALKGDCDLRKDYEFMGIDEFIENQPTAYDVDKVVEQCENVAEKYADCDEFVCSKCGIHLGEWVEVSIDEDYDDEIHSEYVFKYCPNCGAKIKAGD